MQPQGQGFSQSVQVLAPSAQLVSGVGPTDLQSRLLQFVRDRFERLGVVAAIAQPLRILVPSATLRDRVSRCLTSEVSDALLGVEIQTVLPLVESILRRSGQRFVDGDSVYEVLVRRAASESKWVEERLGRLSDGLGLVSASVRTLLGAGLDSDNLPAVAAQIELEPGNRWALEILKIAAATVQELESVDARRRAGKMTQAAEALARDSSWCPHTDEFVLYGFSDAPGTTIEFFKALSHVAPATIFVDLPEDVYGRGCESVGCAHPRRFVGLLGADLPKGSTQEAPDTELRFIAAPDRSVEVREVAWRIREELAAGIAPEDITVAVGELAAYGPLIRRHFRQLALPYSAGSVSLPLPVETRLAHAWGQLLERREMLELDLFLSMLVGDETQSVRQKQAVAFRVMGASRLGDVLGLDLDAHSNRSNEAIQLPIRHAAAAKGETGLGELVSCSVAMEGLAAIIELARTTLGVLQDLPDHGVASEFEEPLRQLGDSEKGMLLDEGVSGAFRKVAEGLPQGFKITVEEYGQLLRQAVEEAESAPLNGCGGGVAVVSWTQVRSCASQRLYVLGVNRGALPKKGAQDDPFLPDGIRRRVRHILPCLALIGNGGLEQQHAFASLLSAAPRVTVSWLLADEGGKALQPSPYLQRLFVEEESLKSVVQTLPVQRDEQLKTRSPDALPIDEALQLGALHQAQDVLQPLLQESASVEGVAAAQLAAVGAMESPGGAAGMARMGQVGRWEDSPVRRDDLSATFLESIARCPWASYLERILRVAPLPDPRSDLPEISALMLGNSVHLALEKLLPAGGEALEDQLSTPPTDVRQPSHETLCRLLRDAVHRETVGKGLDYPGLQQAVFERAFPMVQAAIALHWTGVESVSVVGVELGHTHTFIDTEGRPRRITFKADRVDLVDGVVHIMDYKTGKHIGKKSLSAEIARGSKLQAPLYAASAEETGMPTAGSYLFLSDDPEVFSVESDDLELQDCFEGAVSEILRALDSGSMPPRMLNKNLGSSGPSCGYCQLKQACSLRDISSQRRLVEDVGQGLLSDAFHRIWHLKETVESLAAQAQEERDISEGAEEEGQDG